MRTFHDLRVWHKSHVLTLDVYGVTRAFPKAELYGLTSQLRRAASSIPANLAEGCGRTSQRDLIRFLQLAAGSASELEYHLLLAQELNLMDASAYLRLVEEVSEVKRMLNSFTQK